MQHMPKWFVFLILGFVFIGTVSVYAIQSYRYHDITKLMKESAQVVITESVDYSLRVNENNVVISEELFEKNFKKRFEKLKGGFKVNNYSFKYLKDGNLYKAVKIKIIDDQGSPHEVTLVTDFKNS